MKNLMCSIFVVFCLVQLGSCLMNEDAIKHNCSLAPFFNRKYELVSSGKDYDRVLETLGLDFVKRTLSKFIKPVIELSEGLHHDEYSLKIDWIFKQTVVNFKPGVEFDDETPDGREVRSTFFQDGDLLLHVEEGDKTMFTLHQFSEQEVKETVFVDGVTSVRIFKLVI